jgi:hypothetical protein
LVEGKRLIPEVDDVLRKLVICLVEHSAWWDVVAHQELDVVDDKSMKCSGRAAIRVL